MTENVEPLQCCPVCEGTGWRYYEWEVQPQQCVLCGGTGRRGIGWTPRVIEGGLSETTPITEAQARLAAGFYRYN